MSSSGISSKIVVSRGDTRCQFDLLDWSAYRSIEILPLEDAALAHRMIETGHVREKLVLKIAEFSD